MKRRRNIATALGGRANVRSPARLFVPFRSSPSPLTRSSVLETFGGHGQVVQVAPHLKDRLEPWQAQKAAIEQDFPPPPRRLDGYVRIWAGLGQGSIASVE